MGEPTCVMQPLSYTSVLPNESIEENPLHALGQSISFGRFMTESLSWEKWSTFSHKRYVEEAEKYSRPGSVAEKKAFFEAHYKRVAAKKAAALLEQANSNSTSEDNLTGSQGGDGNNIAGLAILDSQSKPNQQQQVQLQNNAPDSAFVASGFVSGVGMEEGANLEDGKTVSTIPNNALKVEQSNQIEGVDKPEGIKESRIIDSGKPLTKNWDFNKENMVSLFNKSLSSPANYAIPMQPKKEGNSTPTSKNFTPDSLTGKGSHPDQLVGNKETPLNEVDPPVVMEKQEKLRESKNSSRASKDLSTLLRSPTEARASKDLSTLLRSPTEESGTGASMSPAVTPSPDLRMPKDCSANGIKASPRRRSLATDFSKFVRSCKNKLQSPGLMSPFRLKTEERTTMRKQKLEDKFGTADVQSAQLPIKLQEKKEKRKWHHNFCFTASQFPDFDKEKVRANDQMKKSSKPGRKTVTAKVQKKSYPPSHDSSNKDDYSNNFR